MPFQIPTRILLRRYFCHGLGPQTWEKGTVVDVVRPGKSFDIDFNDDARYEENASIRRIHRPVHLEEGLHVIAYVNDEALQGVITFAHANVYVDISLNVGDEIMTDVLGEDYNVQYPTF